MNNITIRDKADFLNLIKENPEDHDKFEKEKATAYRHFKIRKLNGERSLYAIKSTSLLYKYQHNLIKKRYLFWRYL